jgi:uncharacterized protein (TIGR03086 family)
MPDPIADFTKAADGFAAVLAGCADKDLSGRSPCTEWDAQGVIDHVLQGYGYFITAFGGEPPDVSGIDDPSERCATLRAALQEQLDQPGALEKTVPGPVGDMPGAGLLGIAMGDSLLHTWDLARATGQDVTLDADVLQQVWDNIKPVEAMVRGAGVFGPAVEVPDDAPFQDRALAFFGRTP